MSHLTLDDFEWVEEGFDSWKLMHKRRAFYIAAISNFNGWRVFIMFDGTTIEPLHVDTLDAAKALAQIISSQYMEKYDDHMRKIRYGFRTKRDGPPPVRAGVFQVG